MYYSVYRFHNAWRIYILAIKARLEGELKYFGKYKSKILNNETN